MKILSIILLLFMILIACKKEKKDVTIEYLKTYESLLPQDNEGLVLDFISEIKVIDDELYCYAGSIDAIYVFDPIDLKFKRSFGNKGKGPGEFNYCYGIAKYDSTSILIADKFNHRVQRLDRYGNNIENLRFPWVSKFQTRNNNFYASAGKAFCSAKIYKFKMNGEREVVFDAKEYCEKNDISYTNLIAFYFVNDDESVIMAINENKKIIKFSENEEVEFETPFSDEVDFTFGVIKEFKDGYLISSFYHDKKIEMPMIKDIRNVYLYYSKEGKILKEYRLPSEIGCGHITFDIWNGYIFCSNQNEGILYKIKIENNEKS